MDLDQDLAGAGRGPGNALEPHRFGRAERVHAPGHHRHGGLYFVSGVVRGLSPESTTKTASRLAGSRSLAFSLTR